jgi:hypothetical protein
VPAHQLAHRRIAFNAAEKVVIFGGDHGGDSKSETARILSGDRVIAVRQAAAE